MADVANLGTRRTAVGRVTNNRDVVIPTRRLIDAPQLRNREDMRNANRGDDEVNEIKRTLGLITDTAEGVAEVGTKRFAQRAEQDAGKGRADEAMGQVDEAKAKTSTAYRVAIAMSRARKKSAEIELILRPEIEDLLSKGADADPTKGEQPVDLEDVNELIEARFKSLVLGEDGKPIDFGDAAANMEVYSKLEEMRPKLLSGAQEVIRSQEAEKVIRGFGDELELEIAKAGTANIESYMGRLPPGVDRNKARAALMDAVVNGAEQSENPEVLLKAADSRRADGTPTWTPQQEGRLRDEARRQRAELDRKHDKEAEEASHETLGTLSVLVRSGKRLDPAHISELIAARKLRPQDAELAFAIQERVDDDKWEDVQRARANVNWAESRADRAYTLSQRRQEATGSQAESYGLRAAMISGNLSPGQAHRAASQLFAQGKISLKTYDFLADEAKKIKTDDKAVKDADAEGYEARLTKFATTVSNTSRDGKPGRASVDEVNLRNAQAKHTFYRALRQGREPHEAFALAIGSYPGVDPKNIGIMTGEARSAEGRKRSAD